MTYGRQPADLRRVLDNLGPVYHEATMVMTIYREAIRTGDLNPHELRRALLALGDAAVTAEGRVHETVRNLAREAA